MFGAVVATALHASTWMMVSNPRFEIVTNAGELAARQLVMRLEQFDGAIAHSAAPTAAFARFDAPLRVYLFRSEAEFAEFRGQSWEAGLTITSGNSGSPFILLYAGPGLRHVAIHEYIHALVKRGDWKLPHWFEEGLAEIYSHSEVTGHNELSIGQQIPAYLGQLKNQTLKPSLLVEEPGAHQNQRFYAASWALVHMMMLDARYRPLTERLLGNGAWEGSIGELMRDLQGYVARPIWNTVTVSAPSPKSPDVAVKALTPLDAEFMLAALLLDSERPQAAQTRYRKIAATHSGESSAAEATAFLALAEGQLAVARKQFRRAVNLRSNRARAWFELALLERDAALPWSEVKPLLEGAAKLDPSDYQAPFLLGIHFTDDGDFLQAVNHLAAAAKSAPGRADVWHAYGFALGKAGRREEARAAARRALRVASSPEWERMATEMLASLDRSEITGPPLRRTPTVVTSLAWTPAQPDAYAEGRFVEFLCQGEALRLRLAVAVGEVKELKIADPNQVRLRNAAAHELEFRCGSQAGNRIRVGYRKSDGVVLEIDFLP